uniref:Conserved domain protein n=1 Tax=Strongyloides venezuelensis TaxID=75913 RepID=A0A0K0FVX4_STRVS
MGKSCLERWIDESNIEGGFNYGIENKYKSEDDITRRCALGTLKEGHFFIEQVNREKREFDEIYVDFFDAYNGYIQIVGSPTIFYDNDIIYFLRIYEDDRMCYNKYLKSADISAVELNKYCKDCLEFCVGLKNRVIHNTVFTLFNGISETPHESILFNENEKINSICYLGHNDILETNLKVINDSTLLGIMDNKIYVFGRNIVPYEIYSDEDLKFSSFEYDSVSKMISINAMKLKDRSHSYGNLNAVLLDSHDCRIFESSLLISTKRYGENLSYTFIPDLKNDILRAYAINNGFLELVNDEEITCLEINTRCSP